MAKAPAQPETPPLAGEDPASADSPHGPSPDPKTNLMLAAIALRGGEMLLRRGVGKRILGLDVVPGKAKDMVKGGTLGETLVTTAIVRIATRSVPGAILVGGGLLAKTLYDRRKAKQQRDDAGKTGDRAGEKAGDDPGA